MVFSLKEKGKEKEKEKETMLQQKSAKLEKMKFTNHREFMKALIAVEFDAMGLSYDDWVNNHEEMQEFIRKKKARLLEIEFEKKKKNSLAMDKLVLEPPTVASEPKKLEELLNDAIPEPKFDTQNRKRESASLGLEEKKKKKVKDEKINLVDPPVAVAPAPLAVAPAPLAPAIPEKLMNTITRYGGEYVEWVMEKSLSKTDVNKHHSRLSIPGSQEKLEDYLTKNEKKQISKNTAIPVDVLMLVTGDDEPQLLSLNFYKWRMNNSGIYILRTNWRKLLEDNDLQEGEKVQVWSFRRSLNEGEKKRLSFAINVLRREE
ncbi:hypothetical protein NE237_001656 [Protea cynaroides]|uniref:B3 domain-containing protein n=1 Tax=Protea cynaroides TaxID=273540 RepID=A0A9Q0KTQ7_9MAGN|nr:hypothetical protein NE237_001656 [Protea cynaroides]